MTDNVIVAGLEHCSSNGECKDCPANPRVGNCGHCTNALMKGALDYINRLRTEIWGLMEENEEQDQAIINALHHMKVVRAEAIKEFAERLKAEGFHHKNFGDLVQFEDIDCLVEEMTEETNNADIDRVV